jgi:hypothetical protein
MKNQPDITPSHSTFDSFDYCISFWEGAIDNEEDAALAVRELTTPRHIRAFDDVA